jgi:dolichyl-phosphate beta-glucosyltransferase
MGKSPVSSLFALQPLVAGDSGVGADSAVETSLVLPVHGPDDGLEESIARIHRYLAERYARSFEMIVVPNDSVEANLADAVRCAERIAERFAEVRVVPLHAGQPSGKGAAVRSGLQAARGRWIFLTDADLPYDLRFFDAAAAKLRAGVEFVTGNRRLQESNFRVPVRLLPLAYRRHRISLLCNRLVRGALRIQARDTQCGIKAMSRRFAALALPRLSCPGFLYDVELFLIADGHAVRCAELPVTFDLRSEKTTVQIAQDVAVSLYWLARIAAQRAAGRYTAASAP